MIKSILTLLIAVAAIMFSSNAAHSQTKNITVTTNGRLCSNVEIMLYAIDPSTCVILESNWLTFIPGTSATFAVTSAGVWPGTIPSSTSIIEAVAVQACRSSTTGTGVSCTNVGAVRVGNASNPCSAFPTVLLGNCFEEPGTCGFCPPNNVYNVKYNHVTSTTLLVDVI